MPYTRMPVSSPCCSGLATISSAMRSTVGASRSAASSLHSSRVACARWPPHSAASASQVGAILHGRAHRRGKTAHAGTLTAGTTEGFDLMLLGQQADFRHVQDLTAFGDPAGNLAEVRSALLADQGTLTHDGIWRLHQRERVPSMSRLTARRLAAGTTRTPWQTCQPIRGWRLTACATVLGQAIFELLDPRMRLGQLLLQWQQLRDQRFEATIFFAQGLQFFVLRHARTLTAFLSFGKSLGDLSSYMRYLLI